MVQKLMAYDAENPATEEVVKLIVEVKGKLSALESDNSQKEADGSPNK